MASESEASRRDPSAAQPAAESLPAGSPQESLSQLIARILDQLSVSAWLPAAALVFSLLFLGTLHVKKDVSKTIHDITRINAASLALLVGGVVITTMLTQAFEFEAIRLLEGYSRYSDIGITGIIPMFWLCRCWSEVP